MAMENDVNRKEKIKQIRQSVLQQSRKTVSVKKGDRRTHYLRRCVACGKPLNSYVINENRFSVIVNHKLCYLDDRDFFKLCVCDDIKSCYTYSQKEKE